MCGPEVKWSREVETDSTGSLVLPIRMSVSDEDN